MRPLRHLRALSLFLLVLAPRAHAQQRAVEIQIAPPYMRMVQDAQAQLVATAYDSNGTPVNVRIRWSSSNINVATVAADGTVRGIMPGTVLITAVAEQEGRRILQRATVYVMRPRQSVTVVTVPGEAAREPREPREPGATPPSSATPPVATAPGAPFPGRPPMAVGRGIDSAMRATLNCNEPFMNAANPMRACYDAPATLRDSSFVPPEPPAKERCASVSTVMLLVQVNEHGRVDGVLPFTSSMCGDYIRALVEAARRAVFTPAEQNGKPVRAWVRLHVRGEREEMPPRP